MMTRSRRVAAAVLLIVTGVVHLNLYVREHYRAIPTVGWLFLLTAISAALLALALVVRPRLVVEVSAGLFALGVLGGYLLTLYLPKGLFDFKEPGISYSGAVSIAAEAGIILVLASAHWRHGGHRRVPTTHYATPKEKRASR
jgi:hypothetical protein